jgi:hypothetical protein
MTILFLASILAGVILSAPIGAAGALVADAALAHDRRRLQLNIAAAVAADTLLAVLVCLFAQPMAEMLHDHRDAALTSAGILLVLCGAAMGLVSWHGHRGVPDAQRLTGGARWLAAHIAAAGAVFLSTLLHPGNIAAFLAAGAFFSLHFPVMARCPYLFSAGIGIGGLAAYGAAGCLFWRLRHRADRFVLDFRYAMAVFIAVVGVYLLFRRLS